MLNLEWEAVLICLLGSLVWAPFIYLLIPRFDRADAPAFSERLWLAALGLAAAPTLLAPALAALGLSLRAPEPALPITAMTAIGPPAEAVVAAPAVATPPVPTTPEAVFAALSVIYLYGLVLAFALAGARAIAFLVRVRRSRPVEDRRLIDAVEDWRKRLNVSARPSLRYSEETPSVCVYGLLRPVILIPGDLFSRVSFKDGVLMCAHELAHIKRGDARLFALCTVANVIFWFNPFMRRITARIALAAEQNADKLVLCAGVDRRAYAACFVEGLKFAARSKLGYLAPIPSFTPFDRRSRRQRFEAILSGASESLPGAGRRVAVAAALAIAGGLVFAQAALAVDPRPREESTALGRLPVNGPITLPFEQEIEGDLGKGRPLHEGVDIAAPRGAAIVAPADGTVIEATGLYRGQPAWGNVVVIDHGDGLITRYAHLDSYAVRKGDRVSSGQKIGEVGATGKASGPHLHFETLRDGEPTDPLLETGLTAAPAAPGAPTKLTARAPVAIPETKEVRSAAPETAPRPTPAAPATAPTPSVLPKVGAVGVTGNVAPLVVADGGVELPIDGETAYALAQLDPDFPDASFPNFELPDLADLDELILADGSTVMIARGAEDLSPEDRKKLEKALREMREELKRSERQRRKAMEKARNERERALAEVDSIRERALEQSRAARERALERARIERERALEESRIARERASKLAAQERQEALEKARAKREQALRQSERSRERELMASRAARERALQELQTERERAMERSREEREGSLAEARKAREKALSELESRLADMQLKLGSIEDDSDADDEKARRELKVAKRELAAQRAEIARLRKQLEKAEKKLRRTRKRDH